MILYFCIYFCLHNLYILYKHSSKITIIFVIIDVSEIHYVVNIFSRMTNMLRKLCITSALHFIDLIQRGGKILIKFCEHLNASAREMSSYDPGVF